MWRGVVEGLCHGCNATGKNWKNINTFPKRLEVGKMYVILRVSLMTWYSIARLVRTINVVILHSVNTNHLALSQEKLRMIPCDINALRSGYSIRESLVRLAWSDGVKLGKKLPKGHCITIVPNLVKRQDSGAL